MLNACSVVLLVALLTPFNSHEVRAQSSSGILQLNAGNFGQHVASKSAATQVLVMFHAPWCPHCVEAKPKLESLAKSLQNDPKIKIAMLDCTAKENQKFCGDKKIEGYPTLRLFTADGKTFDFMDEINENSVKSFLKNPSEAAGHTAPHDQQPQQQQQQEQPDTKMENVLYVSAATFKSELANIAHSLVFFYAPWCGHCIETKPKFAAAASKIVAAKLRTNSGEPIRLVAMNCDDKQNQQFCDAEKIEGYPTIRYFKRAELFAEYDGELEADKFVAFMQAPPTQKVALPAQHQPDQSGQSGQPQHEAAQHEAAQHEDAKMADVVYLTKKTELDAHSQAIVFFYVPGCGHCVTAKPIYAAAARKNKDKPLSFLAINCEMGQNQSLQPICENEKIDTFPTLLHYKRGVRVADLNVYPPSEKSIQDYVDKLKLGKDEL